MNHPKAFTLALVALAVTTGCARDEAPTPHTVPSLAQIASDARRAGHEQQAQALSDGDITVAEYDRGHERNLTCLREAGMTFTDPVRIVTDGFRWDYTINWAGMSEKDGTAASSGCFEKYVGDLELAMTAWGDWQTEPAVLADTVECVRAAGFDVPAQASNYRQLWLNAAEDGLTQEHVSGCVSRAMLRLHPGLGYGVGF